MRPALELVMDVVRSAGASGAAPVPRRLAAFERFARLPDRALVAILGVLDDDEPLRERVLDDDRATEERVGPAGALLLLRPAGWESALDGMVAAAEADLSSTAAASEERSAARRLALVEGQLRSASASLSEARAAAAAAEAALSSERRARRAAESSLVALEARLRAVEAERDAAHRRASMAERAAGSAGASSAPPPAPVLGAAAAGRGGTPGRLPAVLPPGLHDDSPEAAEHLVRVPKAMLLVDGYNASLRAWPELAIVDQRARLVDALAELAARSGVEVVAVFDGDGDGPGVAPAAGGAGGRGGRVRVRFSAAEEEADDVILALVDAAPLTRPVVVASDDRRVRREAAARGANVVTQAQLFGLLRRER